MHAAARGGFVSVAAQRPKSRTVCKSCRKRRQVHRDSGLCSQCGGGTRPSSSSSSSGSLSPPSYDALSSAASDGSASPAASVCQMDTRAVQQVQMLSNFLEVHFPLDTKLESDIHRRLSYLTVLPTVDMSSPLLSNAVNSLCLAHFGSKGRDQRLLHASQDSYGHVLGSLVQALRHSSNAAPRSHRDVIASIMVISLYEDNISSQAPPPSSSSSSNFATHFMGALRYIENVGPSCLDLSTLFDTRLLQNLRMPALVLSIARRKALVFGRPEWKSPNSDHMTDPGPSSWFPLMTGLPELLERADEYMDRLTPEDSPGFMSTCQDIYTFRTMLIDWLDREFQGRIGPSSKGIGVVGINDLDSFDMDIEEHCFMTTSETFKSFHKFLGGAGQLIRCSMSWLACLVCDTTLLRLLVRQPAAKQLMVHRNMQQIEQDAYKSAVELCRCVYHYSALSSIAYVDFVAIFLEMCRNFFEDCGAMREMGWCQACLIATHMREERMRRTHRPTLCRVRDVTNELAMAGRYRSRTFSVLDP